MSPATRNLSSCQNYFSCLEHGLSKQLLGSPTRNAVHPALQSSNALELRWSFLRINLTFKFQFELIDSIFEGFTGSPETLQEIWSPPKDQWTHPLSKGVKVRLIAAPCCLFISPLPSLRLLNTDPSIDSLSLLHHFEIPPVQETCSSPTLSHF